MAFDGIFLNGIIKEMKPLIVGARIDKIFQPAKNLIILQFRSPGHNGKILISAEPNGSRIQITSSEFENPAVPPMLCMLLRKKLVGAKITDISQTGLDRIVKISFNASNELGDDIKLYLICELMGRFSNIILCDQDEKVIDAVRRTDATDTVRVLFPGVKYLLPPSNNRGFDLSDGDSESLLCDEKIKGFLAENGERSLSKVLQENFQGFSPLVACEIAYRATNNADYPANGLSPNQREKLVNELKTVSAYINGEKSSKPTIYLNQNDEPIKFSFMPITQFGNLGSIKSYESLSRLLDGFYAEKEEKSIIHSKSQDILRVLSNASARISKKINIRKSELEKAQNSEQLRVFGELLKGSIHIVKPGDTFCETVNYYSEKCETVRIPLNPALSPAQNAAKYFKDYRKAKTASKLLIGLIEEGEKDLLYLESVFDELSRAETVRELNEIREELVSSGFLKSQRGKSRQIKFKALPPKSFMSTDGFKILSGRNNVQNDQLTLKEAKANDMWFHTKNIPGSHVIVKSNGENIPDTTLNQAAIIAATMSKAGESGSTVAVDYCPVKRVKKPSGLPPGMVIYENYKTAYVTPNKETVLKLMVEE